MERCDFCSVMEIIRKYISEGQEINQVDLLHMLFETFIDDDNNLCFGFDNGLVCRWFKGLSKVSPNITNYYLKDKNSLAGDIEFNILPLMYDKAMAIQEIHDLLIQDPTVSDETKKKLTITYPCSDDEGKASFICNVLCFAMERNFVKRDVNTRKLLISGSLSPVIKDYVFETEVPPPCRHFCGRDAELEDIHQQLNQHGKLFVQGIPGIGKSEVAKAYAKEYREEYTNTVYIVYSGSLKNDIANLDFADDFDDTATIDDRFRKHNRFFRSLKEDTLIVIDNFNTVASDEDILPVVLQYRCQVLFTTRSRFDDLHTYTIEELSEKHLLELMKKLYSEAVKNKATLRKIIKTVHRHTFAVELSARLLEIGLLEPQELLKKLREEKVRIDDEDTIHVTKDGKSSKATYYDHIQTLFELYRLSLAEKYIMRNLSLVPLSGISSKLFAKLIGLRTMNTVNALIEVGFVQPNPGRIISLHPMIRDVAVIETTPSVSNCSVLIHSLEYLCLCHGMDFPFNQQLVGTIMSVIESIHKDDAATYLMFLENVFPHFQRYDLVPEMRLIFSEMTTIIENDSAGRNEDRALLLDYQSIMENNPQTAIELGKKAIATITEITADNAQLVANLYTNLSSQYKYSGNMEEAKRTMEEAIRIVQDYNFTYSHDIIDQVINFAILLSETGEAVRARSMLTGLSRSISEQGMERTMDQAIIQKAIGGICLGLRDYQQAEVHYKNAIIIYRAIFGDQPAMLEANIQDIKNDYAKLGLVLNRKMIS